MTYVLLAIYFLVFLYLIKNWGFFKRSQLNPRFLQVVFTVKFLFTIILYLIYTKYYNDRSTADIFKYFDDSLVMVNALTESPIDYFKMLLSLGDNSEYFKNTYYGVMNHWYKEWDTPLFNDNRTMIRINALFGLFSFKNFHIHQLFSSFLSLIGLTAFYRFFKDKIRYKVISSILFFFMPSLLLWASGMLKETFIILFVGLFLISIKKIIQNNHLKDRFLLVASFLVLLLLKPYIIILLTPFIASYYYVEKKELKKPYMAYIIIFVVALFFTITSRSILGERYDILSEIFKKQADFIRLTQIEQPGSILPVHELKPHLIDFILASPRALYNTVILKLPWQSRSIMELLPLFENLGLILLTLFALANSKWKSFYKNNHLLLTISFGICMMLLIGWTTPVLGAIVRYRVPVLPFWLLSIFSVAGSIRIFDKIEESSFYSWVIRINNGKD